MGVLCDAATVRWTDIATALATIATFVVLLGSGIFASLQLLETRKTRAANLLADLFRRWDEPLLRTARKSMNSRSPEQIRDVMQRFYSSARNTETENLV